MTAALFIAYIVFLAFIGYAGDALKKIALLCAWCGMALAVLYAVGLGLHGLFIAALR